MKRKFRQLKVGDLVRMRHTEAGFEKDEIVIVSKRECAAHEIAVRHEGQPDCTFGGCIFMRGEVAICSNANRKDQTEGPAASQSTGENMVGKNCGTCGRQGRAGFCIACCIAEDGHVYEKAGLVDNWIANTKAESDQ